MTYHVSLTMQQRIGLEAILGAQTGTIEQLSAYFDLRRKLETTSEERLRYLTETPQGSFWNDDALAIGPSFDLEVESEEMRKLEKLLETWPHVNTNDLKWLLPLRQSLRDVQSAARKPPKKANAA